MKKIITFLVLVACLFLQAKAQDDLLSMIGDPTAESGPVYGTFKGTRLINFHTIEVPGERTLDFRIAHRFGTLNTGGYNLWGLDGGGASIRLSLEYSYDARLAFGIGRSNVDKTFDGFAKYRLLRQTEDGSMPISLTLFSGAYATSLKDKDDGLLNVNKYEDFSSRLSFCHQIILGRKFSDKLSVQVAPTLVHYNLADDIGDKNDIIIVAAAARYKFTQRLAFTVEYGWRANDYAQRKYYDSFGIGFDIDTGGHVFQVHLTNSQGMTENQYFTRTADSWGDKGIRLGFNISRVFTI